MKLEINVNRSSFIVLLLVLLAGIILSQPSGKRKGERERSPFAPSQPQPHARPAASAASVNRAKERFNAMKARRQAENQDLFDQFRAEVRQ